MEDRANRPAAASGERRERPSDAPRNASGERPRPSVLAAMSGGVDSSVAALLLQEAGYQVMGVTLRLFDNDDVAYAESHGAPLDDSSDVPSGAGPAGFAESARTVREPRTCCSLSDVLDASAVCAELGVEHMTFNFRRVFAAQVIDRFCQGYLDGLTPNPCIDCNRYVKFEALQRRRRDMGYDYVATGHYARRAFDERTGRHLLLRGRDAEKDQSYVLYHLTQEQLAHMLFPLGDLEKSEVRALAEAHGFVNARKPDSQDICFVPDGDYAAFIESRRGPHAALREGPVEDEEGHVLGTHAGIARYTVGQRRGIGIAAREPLAVFRKDAARNALVVAPASRARTEGIVVEDANLIACEELDGPVHLDVKTGYRQRPVPAVVRPLGRGALDVRFDEPQRPCAPGQSAVLYDGDVVVGGGTIAS